jgi:hypothetical protein
MESFRASAPDDVAPLHRLDFQSRRSEVGGANQAVMTHTDNKNSIVIQCISKSMSLPVLIARRQWRVALQTQSALGFGRHKQEENTDA